MKVKAKNHINYNGTWITGGEVFDVADNDFDAVAEFVSVVKEKDPNEFVSDIFTDEAENAEKAEQPKRGRRKRNEN